MRRAAIFLTILYLALSVGGGIFLCESTLHPARRPLTPQDKAQAQTLAQLHEASLDDISITTPDNLQLNAWLLTPQSSNHQAVILLHGLGDNRAGMFGYAALLLAHHFIVLLPDARAHGSSGGSIATYGLLERNDIHQWFDWLASHDQLTCIDGFGESMGAAQLLQSLAVEPNFCAVAAESSFSNFHEIAYDRAGQYFSTGPWLGRTLFRPALAFAFWYGKEKYGLNLAEVAPEAAVAATRTPVFLIHGQDDSNIPVRHSERITARNHRVALWEVPNTEHCGAMNTAPEEFQSRLLTWFSRAQVQTLQSAILVHPLQ